MTVPISLIQQFRIFDSLPQAEILAISLDAYMSTAKTNTTILARGLTLDYLCFIVSGRLQVTEYAGAKHPVGIQFLGPGSILGEVALIDQKPISYAAKTLEQTSLLLLPMLSARRLALSQPIFSQRILLLLAQKIERSNFEKSMLTIPNAYHRVFVQLHLLSHTNPLNGSGQTLIPKQQDLARMANTSRETVSRALKNLIDHGVLTKRGHQIQIHNTQLLMELAQKGPEFLQTDMHSD